MTETQRAAMQQALEFCEELQGGCTDSDDGTVEAITVWCPEVIAALRAALAEPVQEFASIPGTNVRVRLPSQPHDAGSHDQRMTPAVQRVVDAADKRAQDKAAMPADCTTPSDCRAHGCHGACLPAALAEPETVADEVKAQAFDALSRMSSFMPMNDGRHPRDVLRAFVQLASAPPARQPLTPAQEAAPELLEALKYALKDMCQVRDQVAHNRLLVSIGVASAAITKAERQPSDEMRAAMDAAREAN